MAKATEALGNVDVAEMRAALASRISNFTKLTGEHPTQIPGLTLFRRVEPTACQRVFYEPSLAVFTQGRKFLNVGGTEYFCVGCCLVCPGSIFRLVTKFMEPRKSFLCCPCFLGLIWE